MDNNINQAIREFILSNVPALQNSNDFNDDTPLITSRLIDSIIALKLITYVEEKFNVEFQAHEVNEDNLNTVNILADFIKSKMK